VLEIAVIQIPNTDSDDRCRTTQNPLPNVARGIAGEGQIQKIHRMTGAPKGGRDRTQTDGDHRPWDLLAIRIDEEDVHVPRRKTSPELARGQTRATTARAVAKNPLIGQGLGGRVWVVRNFWLTGLLLGASTVGCGKSDPASPGHDARSDATVALDVYPTDFIAENTPMNLLAEGAAVQLVSAPQGGHVIHVGARVRGLSSDQVNIRARIRDPDSNVIQTEEARDVVMKPVPGEPDLMENDLRSVSQVTHIPACPDYDAVDIVDRSWRLEVIVREISGPGEGSATLVIELVCSQTEPGEKAQCQCECEKNYVLGKCVGDAGSAVKDAGT